MRSDEIRRISLWALALMSLPALTGCGGGVNGAARLLSGASGGSGVRKSRLTRFDVNVATGKVKVSSPAGYGRAVLTGGAVTFSATDLLAVGGSSGKRHINLTVQSNALEGMTQGRVVIGNLSNTVTGAAKNSAMTTTSAGSGVGGSADGSGAAASFLNPVGIAAGDGPSQGSYFISDSGNSTIRRMFPDGSVTTFAGLALFPGSADGNGPAARFNSPGQTAVDGYGNVFVADTGNHTVRRITPLGEVSTIAGLAGIPGHVDGVGASATFTSPTGIAVSFFGDHIYVSESHDIRSILYDPTLGSRDTAAAYTTALIAGDSSPGFADGDGASARFSTPFHLAFAANGATARVDLFVADTGNNAIRRIQNPDFPGAPVHTIAGGNGVGTTDGVGSVATFNAPSGLAAVPPAKDGAEFRIFVSDKNSGLIRLISFVPGNELDDKGNYTVSSLSSGSGFADGDGNSAKYAAPLGIAALGLRTAGPAPSATLEIVDQVNQRIRKLTVASAGLTSGGVNVGIPEPVRILNWDTELPNQSNPTVAWGKTLQTAQSSVDLQFFVPLGVSAFSFTAYVEGDTSLINLPAAGASYVTTLAGNGTPGDSNGPGRLAQFNSPYGIAVIAPSLSVPVLRVAVADQANQRIRIVDTRGVVSTLVGSVSGFTDGPGNQAQFFSPRGVASAPDGSLLVADNGNRRIRRIAFTVGGPVVSTIAGTGAATVTDGTGDAAAFSDPTGIAVDGGGSIFVTEQASDVVRKITYSSGDRSAAASYTVSTIAGAANVTGSTDGAGASARFSAPLGIYADTDGMLYVADSINHTIRALARTGVASYTVSTIAGAAGTSGTTDAIGSAARLNLPAGITGDTAHNLYVSEFGNHRIRRISPSQSVVTIAGSSAGLADGPSGQLNGPVSLAVSGTGTIFVADQNNHAIRTVQRLISDGQPPQ